MFLDVASGHLLERPPATQCQPIGMRVSALGDLNHDLARQPAGLGQRYRTGVAQMNTSAVRAGDRVDALPGAVAGRLHRQRQAVLQRVPVHDDPVGVWPHGPDEGVRQPPPVRAAAGRGAVASGSGHAE